MSIYGMKGYAVLCPKGEPCIFRNVLYTASHRQWDRHGGLVVRASASWAGCRGLDPRSRQTKVLKTGSSGFLPFLLRIMGKALPQARQCQDNGHVHYWLKIVQETWICELSLLDNWNTVVDTALNPKQAN